MTRAYLALGSNLGDRMQHLQLAVDGLRAADGVRVDALSHVYETAPVGGPEQGPYLNAVVAVDTDLDPWPLLALAHALEHEAQRVRAERWGPRTLDVDVLSIDGVALDDPDLTMPHPRMWERAFVLMPFADVAPALVADATVERASKPRAADGVTRTVTPYAEYLLSLVLVGGRVGRGRRPHDRADRAGTGWHHARARTAPTTDTEWWV